MIIAKILLLFFLSMRFILASNISLRSDMRAIPKLHAERIKEFCNSFSQYISIRMKLENILELDPIEMLEEMMEITDDDEGVTSFWLYLDIFTVVNCGPLPRFKEGLD